MTRQLHGRLTDNQVAAILSRYVNKDLSAAQAMSMLEVGRSQFFGWVKKYKQALPDGFSIGYAPHAPNRRIDDDTEMHILDELRTEKALIDDPSMPVRSYNYSYIRDQILKKHHEDVSLPTIIDRAKKGASTFRRPRKPPRSRGNHQLCRGTIQHDSSHHRWSPYVDDRWCLITSVDDYSRYLLYSAMLEKGTSMAAHTIARDRVARPRHPLLLLCGQPFDLQVH